MQPTSSDRHVVSGANPYRASTFADLLTFTKRERGIISGTARWMKIAGGLGLVAAAIDIPSLFRAQTASDFVFGGIGGVALPMIFAILTLVAGVVLERVQRTDRPYESVEASIAAIRIVFKAKGVILIALVALAAFAFFLSLVLSLVL